MNVSDMYYALDTGEYDGILGELYGPDQRQQQKQRYRRAVKEFTAAFPGREDVHLYSASGRTEVGGNHTDHQRGCVIAAAVNLDAIGVTAFHDDGVIRIKSEGYEGFEVALSDLEIRAHQDTPAELVRGIAAGFTKRGVSIGGFDMYITSDVLGGSGLSSSAAFENLISTAIDCYYHAGKAGAVEIAKTGWYAENVYYGKNSGLMDQMVSAAGGFVFIDFNQLENPKIRKVHFNLKKAGYDLIITDTKGSHTDLTEEYDAVRREMDSVAGFFGKQVLREVEEDVFWENLPEVRRAVSDRAVLRAAHFFGDNARAVQEKEALERGDFEEFLRLVNESGESSMNLLQNLYAVKNPTEQAIPLAIMVSRRILGKRGAVRVHGGGFAGTVQAFVPCELTETYIAAMEGLFGKQACYPMSIRPYGSMEIIGGEAL